ncbi:MAG: FecR domain-containing protein [Treponema sp.]|nr:FecR domain-containing protein [Treponema sp.]
MKKKRNTRSASKLVDAVLWVVCLTGMAVFLGLFLNDWNKSSSRDNEEPVATVVHKKNMTQRRFADNEIWQKVKVADLVYGGDRIRTEAESEATIIYNDGTTVDMYENTIVIIRDKKDGTGFDFAKGSVNVVASENAENKPVVITRGSKVLNLSGKSSAVVDSSKSGEASVAVTSGTVSVVEKPVEVPQTPQSTIRKTVQKARAAVTKTETPEPVIELQVKEPGEEKTIHAGEVAVIEQEKKVQEVKVVPIEVAAKEEKTVEVVQKVRTSSVKSEAKQKEFRKILEEALGEQKAAKVSESVIKTNEEIVKAQPEVVKTVEKKNDRVVEEKVHQVEVITEPEVRKEEKKAEKARVAKKEAEEKAAVKKAEEKRAAEAAAKKAEEKRIAEKKAEEKKAAEAAAKKAEEKRLAEKKEAERKLAEKKAAEKKAAEEKARVEAARRSAEEKARVEAAKKAEEKRLAEEARIAEEKRLAEEARIAEEAAKKVEEERLAKVEAEKKAAREKLAEKKAKEAEERKVKLEAEAARKAEKEKLALEALRRAEEERAAEEARLAEEAAAKKAEEERLSKIEAEKKAKELSEARALEMKKRMEEKAEMLRVAKLEEEKKAREEAERKELELKEAERKEAERKEAEIKEAELREAERKEEERKSEERLALAKIEAKADSKPETKTDSKSTKKVESKSEKPGAAKEETSKSVSKTPETSSEKKISEEERVSKKAEEIKRTEKERVENPTPVVKVSKIENQKPSLRTPGPEFEASDSFFGDDNPVIKFTWAKMPDAKKYHLVVYKDGLIDKKIVDKTIKGNAYTLKAGELENLENGTYVWSVTGIDTVDGKTFESKKASRKFTVNMEDADAVELDISEFLH